MNRSTFWHAAALVLVVGLVACGHAKAARPDTARAVAVAPTPVQQATPRAVPAPPADSATDHPPLVRGPIPASVAAACDSAEVFVHETLALPVHREDGTFHDSFANQPRQGCRLVANGSFRASPGPISPVDTLRAVFIEHHWGPDLHYDADGPDGSDVGMRRLENLCLVGGSWDGGDDDDTTTRAPTPEQDLYQVTVECARDLVTNDARDVPDSLWAIARAAGLDSLYAFSFRVQLANYRTGDFAGDSVPDAAVIVEERRTGKLGVAFIHRGTRQVYIAGAGTPIANGPDDLSWMSEWEVRHKGLSYDTVIRDQPAKPYDVDALWVAGGDSIGGFIQWTGHGYAWEPRPRGTATPPPGAVIIGRPSRRPPP